MGIAFSFGNHGFEESRLRKRLLKHFAVPAVDAALEEMLFTGGALNRRLLGGDIPV